jgi:hypothetical protein
MKPYQCIGMSARERFEKGAMVHIREIAYIKYGLEVSRGNGGGELWLRKLRNKASAFAKCGRYSLPRSRRSLVDNITKDRLVDRYICGVLVTSRIVHRLHLDNSRAPVTFEMQATSGVAKQETSRSNVCEAPTTEALPRLAVRFITCRFLRLLSIPPILIVDGRRSVDEGKKC